LGRLVPTSSGADSNDRREEQPVTNSEELESIIATKNGITPTPLNRKRFIQQIDLILFSSNLFLRNVPD
jgi:hypothetical protein